MRMIALSAVLLLAAPAFAADGCATQPAALRQAAATADTAKAKKAMYLVGVGEKLCAAGAGHEADSKFAMAAKTLGNTEVASKSGTPTAQ